MSPTVRAVSSSPRLAPSVWRLVGAGLSPIVALNAGGCDGPAIYCVHPIGGDVDGLRPFAAMFGRQRVYGVQVPKEKMHPGFAASIEAIARHHVAALVAFQPDGPVILGGWSAGAIVALEMARQLSEAGRDVPLLVALDGAPCNTGGGLSAWNPLYAIRVLANLPRWLRDDRNQDWSPRGLWRRVDSKLAVRLNRALPSVPGAQTLDAGAVETVLASGGWTPAMRAFVHAMYKAMVAYVPRRYDGRVLVYETRTQPLYRLRQVGAAWRAIAADVEIVPLAGNHSGLIAEPSIGFVAKDLLGRLDAARI